MKFESGDLAVDIDTREIVGVVKTIDGIVLVFSAEFGGDIWMTEQMLEHYYDETDQTEDSEAGYLGWVDVVHDHVWEGDE